jgi:hypothetical protein
MPSRKKAKGKARKAAKEVKAKAEESRAVAEVAVGQRQEGSLESQLHRIVISDVASQKCQHGLGQLSADEEKICEDFINACLAVFTSQDEVGEAILAAVFATSKEYADVYASKLDTVVSMLLASGTQRILDGDKKIAQLYASLACYFEDYMAVCLHKTRAAPDASKLMDLQSVDDHTLVSYYRKRIPCACLDQKYKEVKSVKKMGRCYNPSCSHPGRKVERSKMFSCTRCGVANYCSAECQRADWKIHKQICGCTAAEMIASFSSSQT